MWLEVLSGEDAGRVVRVDRPLVLGRVQGSDVVIRDPRASRRHAELAPVQGGVRLHDLGSANGTLVDGEPARDVVLCGGETLRIGDVRIAVLAEEPAVTGAPIAERVRPQARLATEGPSWSTIGRMVDARTRRGRRLTYAALALAVAVAAIALGGALSGSSDEERVAEVVRTVAPATVRIEARSNGARGGLGSGWVLEPQAGLIVTAAHVINTGERFFARWERTGHGAGDCGAPRNEPCRDREAEAELVAAAPCEDLAVLRVDGLPRREPPALGDSGGAAQAEPVLAFGFPEAAEPGERRLPRAASSRRRAPRSASRRRTSRPTRRRSAPTPRSIPASPAARSSTSRATSSA